MMPTIAVSVVSHDHGEMVNALVGQLLLCPEVGQIILTRNIPETTVFISNQRINVIENRVPKGFGANHNAAFKECKLPFFCVLNPDIVLEGNPFPQLIECLSKSPVKLCAPAVVAPDGRLEDSVRHFPTLRSLILKAIGGNGGRYEVEPNQQTFPVDWVAGMFMLFCTDSFRSVGGFDEKYFLYYEDVDICARLWNSKSLVAICPNVQVIHAAQRTSRTNFRYMRWHVASMLRFFSKHWWRLNGASTN
jgi:N-acetylglucosaminyl-diphospho-decaprenol L-rhamnosyltransferase